MQCLSLRKAHSRDGASASERRRWPAATSSERGLNKTRFGQARKTDLIRLDLSQDCGQQLIPNRELARS